MRSRGAPPAGGRLAAGSYSPAGPTTAYSPAVRWMPRGRSRTSRTATRPSSGMWRSRTGTPKASTSRCSRSASRDDARELIAARDRRRTRRAHDEAQRRRSRSARGQGKAELVAPLDGVEHARAVLVPELVPGGREPAGAPVEHVDPAWAVDRPDVLPGHAHGQIGAAVPIQVARGQGVAEVVELLGAAEHAGAVLAPELVPGRREPLRAAVEDADRAGAPAVGDGLAGNTDGQVGPPVAVEVTRGQGSTKVVARVGGVGDAGAVLTPELVPGRRQTPRAAVEDVYRAGIARALDGLVEDADSQIVAAVAVEVARGQGPTEEVGLLRNAPDAGAVLMPELVPGCRQAAGAAIEDVDRAGKRAVRDVLVWDAD